MNESAQGHASSKRASTCAAICALLGACGIASAVPGDGLFDFTAIGGANLDFAPEQVRAGTPLPGSGGWGVAARRIAIGEAGVEEHVSNLIVDWPDPFGLTSPIDSSIDISLVAELPGGSGPVRASTVSWTRMPDQAGATSYHLGFDFAQLGSSTATMRITTLGDVVVERQIDSSSGILLNGLPPGEPIVRTVKIPPGIAVDWIDEDDDGDGIPDVDIITILGLPEGITSSELADGSIINDGIRSIELILNGPETEIGAIHGFDFIGSGLNAFTVSNIPSPGAAALLAIGGLVAGRRRRTNERDTAGRE